MPLDMFEIEDEKFSYPDIRYQQVPDATPDVTAGVNATAKVYYPLLQKFLQRPQGAFEDVLTSGSVGSGERIASGDIETQEGRGVPVGVRRSVGDVNPGSDYGLARDTAREAIAYLQRLSRDGNPVDVSGIYDKNRALAMRNFDQYTGPQMDARMGRRGLRWSSNLEDMRQRNRGDIEYKLAADQAKTEAEYSDKAAVRAAEAGRSAMGGAELYARIANAIAALQQSNLGARRGEFQRFQPETYFGPTQNAIATRSQYPPVVTGGAPIYTPPYTIQDAFNSTTSNVGTIASMYAGFGSAKEFKENKRRIHPEEAFDIAEQMLNAPVEKWKYTETSGFADGEDHLGPYAEDLPAQVVNYDGKTVDQINFNGAMMLVDKKQQKEIDELRTRVEKLENA